jgi:hypothetical protein
MDHHEGEMHLFSMNSNSNSSDLRRRRINPQEEGMD